MLGFGGKGMQDAELVALMAEVGLSRRTARLVALLPLVQVAWADGAVQPEERKLILEVAAQKKLADAEGRRIVEAWLAAEPGRRVASAGQRLLQALVELPASDPAHLDDGTLEEIGALCGGVAEAAGGLFGYGRVSAAERAVLAELAPALGLDGESGGSGTDWVCAAEARAPSDIALWSRNVPGMALRAFRGRTRCAAPFERVVGLLLDIPQMRQWLFRCAEARVVSDTPAGERIVYFAVDGIWPLGDRDAVLRVRPTFDAATGAVTFAGVVAPDVLATVPGKVRIVSITSSWRVVPTSDGLVEVEWVGQVDPVGHAPPWLVNTVAVQAPRYGLRRMHQLLDGPADPAHIRAGQAFLDGLR
jgi:hypothetical protein